MKNERGSAMVVVLTLVVLVCAFIVANALTLANVRAQLKRLDHQQQQKYLSHAQ